MTILKRTIQSILLGSIAIGSGATYGYYNTAPEMPTAEYKVVKIIDGDSLKVQIGDKIRTVRVLGLDTPESVHPFKPVECFGKEASDAAKRRLEGKSVKLTRDKYKRNTDLYSRLLRYVEVSGNDFGEEMIVNGYAHAKSYGKLERAEQYAEMEGYAKRFKLGMWSSCV